MADQSTYIKIDRNIERWRWFKNKNTLIVFLWLLLNANVTDHEFESQVIPRGSLVTSLANVGKSTSLSLQEVRTAFLHLKSTGEITTKSCNRYQVITIVNYHLYQDNQQANQHKHQQSINRQSTGNQQQYKNDKNDKNGRIYKGGRKAPPVSPSGESPTGDPERGTNEFRAKSHLLLKEDEGTVDDIPYQYRKMFDNFQDYWRYRNQ